MNLYLIRDERDNKIVVQNSKETLGEKKRKFSQKHGHRK